jgi:hypothetical protein
MRTLGTSEYLRLRFKTLSPIITEYNALMRTLNRPPEDLDEYNAEYYMTIGEYEYTYDHDHKWAFTLKNWTLWIEETRNNHTIQIYRKPL